MQLLIEQNRTKRISWLQFCFYSGTIDDHSSYEASPEVKEGMALLPCLFLSFCFSSSYFIGCCPSSSRVIWAMESKKWTDGWSSLVIGLLRGPSVLQRHCAIFIDQFIGLNQLHFQFDMFGTKRNKNFRSENMVEQIPRGSV